MDEDLLAQDEGQVNSDQADKTQTGQGTPQPSRPTYVWPIVIMVGLVIVAVVAVFLDRQIGGGRLFSFRPVRIAFMSDRDGNWEIYMVDREGTDLTNLTNDPGNDGIPLHAANQDRLAFASDRGSTGLGLFLMSLDGSDVTEISEVPDSTNIPISWSPDGKYLAVNSNQAGTNAIWIIEAEGEGSINLTERDNVRQFGDWSSSSDSFILATDSAAGMTLFITNLAGDETRLLTDGSYPAGGAQWSADGQKVAFMATVPGGGPIDIYVLDVNGNVPINLTQSPANDTFPRWSPDGNKIAFTSDRDGNSEVYVMDADGSNLTNLTNNPAPDSVQGDFAWSPDGTQILFHTDRDGDIEIYLMNADGSNPVNLSNSPSTDFGAIWVE